MSKHVLLLYYTSKQFCEVIMSEKISVHGDTAILEKRKVKRPRRFKVILHNDDYTPMDFVVNLVMGVFQKTHDEAYQIMLTVHVKGKAVCGIYPKEIAESKVDKAMSLAKQEGHPLLCTMEIEWKFVFTICGRYFLLNS